MTVPGRRVQVWLIAKREVSAYLHTPLGYIVAVLFAVLQGFSFWYLASALADPSQPAPLGAALAGHFGGSVLSVTALVAVVAAISMRLVAEEKRQGTWEVLLTAPVSEGAVLIGKWLGATAFFAFLWLPSGLYPLILAHYAAPAASLDPGPIGSALVGIIIFGSALIALGLAASAATSNQIVAVLATTVLALMWILIGDIPEFAPQLASDWPTLHAIVDHVRVRAYLDDLARGLVPLRALVLYASTVALALALATTLALIGRRRPAELARRVCAVGLMAVIAVCANILSARHPVTWDVTRARAHTLNARTLDVLADVGGTLEPHETVQITVIRAGLDIFSHLQAEVDRLLQRMAARQPALVIDYTDPTLQPGRLTELAARFAIPVENLRDGGLVVFQRGARQRAVDIWEVAEFASDDLGIGRLAQFHAQAAFTRALAEVIDLRRPVVCHTTGHGELSLNTAEEPVATGALAAPDWIDIAHGIERDGARLVPLATLAAGVPGHCQVLVMAGPRQTIATSAARAVIDFMDRGGALLLALGPRMPDSAGVRAVVEERSGSLGLELLLADFGIAILPVDVVDPGAALAGADTWFTTTGYGQHTITSGFRDRRATVWLRPRGLTVVENVEPRAGSDSSVRSQVLVSSSEAGFGERTPATFGRAERDEQDLAGPLAVAAAAENRASGARLVVLGSAVSVSSQLGASHGSAGELLVHRSLAWLQNRHRTRDAYGDGTDATSAGGTQLEHMRLLMTGAQLTRTFVLCVVLIPGGFLILGGLIWWRRRRA